MINYFEIREDCIYINYYNEDIFKLLDVLNIPFKRDDTIQSLKIPKIQVNSKNTKSVEHEEIEECHNNGGSTDYYKLQGMSDLQDIIEVRNMNFAQGNILKAAFCFNVGRHEGTSYERELNKIIYFAKRELERIKK